VTHSHVLSLVIVFAFFVGLGFYVRYRYKSRKVFFQNLLSFCDHLLIEISFQKNTVGKIIETYGDSYARHFRGVLLEYQNLIDQKQDITRDTVGNIPPKFLKSPEATQLADFFYELGRHGSCQESTKIKSRRVTFDNFYQLADKSLKRDASIYFKVLILIGVGAVILLL